MAQTYHINVQIWLISSFHSAFFIIHTHTHKHQCQWRQHSIWYKKKACSDWFELQTKEKIRDEVHFINILSYPIRTEYDFALYAHAQAYAHANVHTSNKWVYDHWLQWIVSKYVRMPRFDCKISAKRQIFMIFLVLSFIYFFQNHGHCVSISCF